MIIFIIINALGFIQSLCVGIIRLISFSSPHKEWRNDRVWVMGCMTDVSTMDTWILVGLGGLEPPTSPLSGVRSNQLSYRPIYAMDFLI